MELPPGQREVRRNSEASGTRAKGQKASGKEGGGLHHRITPYSSRVISHSWNMTMEPMTEAQVKKR